MKCIFVDDTHMIVFVPFLFYDVYYYSGDNALAVKEAVKEALKEAGVVRETETIIFSSVSREESVAT